MPSSSLSPSASPPRRPPTCTAGQHVGGPSSALRGRLASTATLRGARGASTRGSSAGELGGRLATATSAAVPTGAAASAPERAAHGELSGRGWLSTAAVRECEQRGWLGAWTCVHVSFTRARCPKYAVLLMLRPFSRSSAYGCKRTWSVHQKKWTQRTCWHVKGACLCACVNPGVHNYVDQKLKTWMLTAQACPCRDNWQLAKLWTVTAQTLALACLLTTWCGPAGCVPSSAPRGASPSSSSSPCSCPPASMREYAEVASTVFSHMIAHPRACTSSRIDMHTHNTQHNTFRITCHQHTPRQGTPGRSI